MTTGQDFLNRAAAIKGNGSMDITYQKHKNLMMGGLIGMGAGFYIGYAKKQNLLVMGMLGLVSGMIIAGAFMPRQ
jgi:hypothetical protein